MRRAILLFLSGLAAVGQEHPVMVIHMKTGDTHLADAPRVSEGRLSRWFDLRTASLSFRHRYLENSRATLANNGQHQVALRGRLHLDRAGRYLFHAGLFTGGQFTGGWNNSGLGPGRAQSNLYLKQLYFSASPVSGLELQYGGLDIAHGESSEITSYDFDGYLVGSRASLRRPGKLFFDDITVTAGRLGDLDRPNVTRRLPQRKRSNYHQLLLGKAIGERVRASAEYAVESGTGRLRQALTVRAPKPSLVLHFEQYQLVRRRAAYGFAAYAERRLRRKLSLGGGYARLDQPGLASDRFGQGKRLFWNTHLALNPEWSVMALLTRAVGGQPASAARTRFDLVISYNFLRRKS